MADDTTAGLCAKDPGFGNDFLEIEASPEVPTHVISMEKASCGPCCRMPPSPQLMRRLLEEFRKESGGRRGFPSFKQWLTRRHQHMGCPTTTVKASQEEAEKKVPFSTAVARVSIPQHQVNGKVYLMVTLVEFQDLKHNPKYTPDYYKQLLFGADNSLNKFYRDVSLGKVEIAGFVTQWLTMPHKKAFYVNGQTGTGNYPNNCQRLAEDAVKEALRQGVYFPPELDFKGNKQVGAFYLVAPGSGAEGGGSTEEAQADSIWSHKFDLQEQQRVAPNLTVTKYLVVPEDCSIGLCAHELGHLAFEWDDFYDPQDANGVKTKFWDGAGCWDLMAGGSWNKLGDGKQGTWPAPPAALHRSQHGWVNVTQISNTTMGVQLLPQNNQQASIVKIKCPQYGTTQSLLLENRSTTQGLPWDKGLPAPGLLVWRVDTDQEQFSPDDPGMCLIQADMEADLNNVRDYNTGDPGDPFPGQANTTELLDRGRISTTFPNKMLTSGVAIKNIRRNPTTEAITFDVIFGTPKPQLLSRMVSRL